MIFDQNQISVIKAGPEPLLVTAGPGSGKTAVLTQRIIYLIKECRIPPDKILVITFTKAAAAEMKSRFEAENNEDSKVTFCTFHSLFYSIIRDFKSENYSIISLNEKLNILKTVLMDMNLDVSRLDLEEIIEEISKIKNLNINPFNYEAKSMEPWDFTKMFKQYFEETNSGKMIDYDDFVILVSDMFDKNAEFLDKWKKKYDYCLIDEFQDINLRQYEIIKRLFSEKSVFAVGDEDQSIYAFRGSSSENYLRFKKDFNANVLKLETNYRSSFSIVNACMKLIACNSLRFDKRIVPKFDAMTGEFKSLAFETAKDEYEKIIKEIKPAVSNGKSVALLLRTNNVSDSLLYCLLKEKVAFVTEKTSISKVNSTIFDDIIAYFKIACGERTYSNLMKIANKPNRYVSRNFIAQCKAKEGLNYADIDGFSYKTLYDCAKNKNYLATAVFKLEMQIKELCKLDSFEGLLYIMNVIGYKKYLTEENRKFETEFEELKTLAREFREKEELIDYYEMNKGFKNENNDLKRKTDKNVLQILTIHASKGREWDEVYIPDVNEGNIPHRKAQTVEEIEEERRLFYVAMTRAKEKLWICYVDDIKRNLKPSVFVSDLRD